MNTNILSTVQDFLNKLETRLAQTLVDLSGFDAQQQFELLRPKIANITDEERLAHKLLRSKETGRPIRVKYGIDPTGSAIHLGHIVPVILLRRFQQMGHHIIFLIGDFTASIGDPTGRIMNRPVLTQDEIMSNMESYCDQIKFLIDLNKAEIRYNSEWLENYKLFDFLQILSKQTVSSPMQRDDFRNRESVTRAELLYSTLMGIDSCVLESEIELGGNDQLLNFMDVKRITHSAGKEPQIGITTPILQGTNGNGQKMSKSAGNFIALTDSPSEIFGKIMSIPDAIMEEYFKLLTDITNEEWLKISDFMNSGSVNPMLVKRLLARVIVTMIAGSHEIAVEAENSFIELFSKKHLPEDMAVLEIDMNNVKDWVDILTLSGCAKTRSEAKRQIESGSVKVVVEKETSKITEVSSLFPQSKTFVLRVGKRQFVQITMCS